MPGIKAVEKLKKALSAAGLASRKSLGKTVTIGSGKMYTTPHGVGAVYSKMAETIEANGGKVRTGCEVSQVRTEGDQVTEVVAGDQALSCDLLVSTVPLNHLALRLSPHAPDAVRDAAGRLGFRALLVAGFLVRPRKRLDAMFTYFPDRAFHRLAEVTDPPAEIKPEGCTILLAEVTCDVGDEVWRDPSETVARIVKDLEAEELVEEIVQTHCFKAAEAYPKYTLGFERDLETVNRHLKSYTNLVSTGRQGAFQFLSMVPSMTKAWKDTNKAIKRTGKPETVKGR
jgi:protoporphyrinogen oxidase